MEQQQARERELDQNQKVQQNRFEEVKKKREAAEKKQQQQQQDIKKDKSQGI
jgi:hypothetical protein